MPLEFSILSAAVYVARERLDETRAWSENFPAPVAVLSDETIAARKFALPTKRRLSLLSKASLHCAVRCCEGAGSAGTAGCDGVPVVFASRYGERRRVVELISVFVEENEVSQGNFSLSVHNAAPGILSIVQKNHAPYTALSAGEETFEAALLEATMQLKNFPRVLLVAGEETAPAHVYALLLGAGTAFSLENVCDKGEDGAGAAAFSAEGFFRFAGSVPARLYGATLCVSRLSAFAR